MPPFFHFSGLSLDRAHHRRTDDAWLEQARGLAHVRYLAVWRDRNLIRPGDPPGAHFLTAEEAAGLLEHAHEIAFLGEINGATYFATDLSHVDEPASGPDHVSFEDLRQHATHMNPDEAGLLAYARGLMYWHRNHRYCGSCGGPTESREAGHTRVCTNEACGRSHFPRTDPAVIMLITREQAGREVCLLGHNARFQGLRYSTLAGFVEPGETLEDAVAREVFEETAIRVADVRYQASQPWPFPASLMVGFRARAINADINVDNDELVDARWFTPEQVREMAASGQALPPAGLSISRWLIDTWLEEQG
jgi:NAD+ diphosphatase